MSTARWGYGPSQVSDPDAKCRSFALLIANARRFGVGESMDHDYSKPASSFLPLLKLSLSLVCRNVNAPDQREFKTYCRWECITSAFIFLCRMRLLSFSLSSFKAKFRNGSTSPETMFAECLTSCVSKIGCLGLPGILDSDQSLGYVRHGGKLP